MLCADIENENIFRCQSHTDLIKLTEDGSLLAPIHGAPRPLMHRCFSPFPFLSLSLLDLLLCLRCFYSISRSLSLLKKEESIRGLLLDLQAIGKGCGMIFLISVIEELSASETQSTRKQNSGFHLQQINK